MIQQLIALASEPRDDAGGKVLWNRLRGNRLGFHFSRQQVVDGFIVDFYCQAGVVVEVNGEIHQACRNYDQERDGVLIGRGLRVIRVRNDEVHRNIDAVLARIAEACRCGCR